MPFKSQAQAKFLFAKHPAIAKEFAAKTASIKALPQHVPATPKKGGDGGKGRPAIPKLRDRDRD